MVRIFGFGHRSRVGKDTVAGFLAGHIRQTTRNKLVVKTAFAIKLKAMTHDLYGWAGLQDADFYERPENEHLRNVKLPEIGKTPVEIWIEFGTTVGRSIFMDTWVKYPLNKKFDFLIIADVRFPNEVSEIRKAGGVVYKVENPNVPIRESVADSALADYKDWNGVIVNHGDLKTLNTTVIDTFKDMLI
jgi:hypothetical protein